MVEFALPAPATPSVAIAGSDLRFPVRRIFCVGRNYADHAREMGHDPNREPPFFFTKPADAVVDDGATLPYPPRTENLHHEAELVVAIGTGGTDIEVADTLRHVWGYGVGNDLTRRDMQAKAKEMRRPWDMAKGFDNSAVCGLLHPVSSIGHPAKGRITAHVDGQLRQDGDIADMIWPVADVIAFLSGLVTLAVGDLIYTGTPAGVGPIARGQSCTITIEGLGSVNSTHV
ncbi:fumarylacetoacetate hydrolase family protein [Profundibacter sp.]